MNWLRTLSASHHACVTIDVNLYRAEGGEGAGGWGGGGGGAGERRVGVGGWRVGWEGGIANQSDVLVGAHRNIGRTR